MAALRPRVRIGRNQASGDPPAAPIAEIDRALATDQAMIAREQTAGTAKP